MDRLGDSTREISVSRGGSRDTLCLIPSKLVRRTGFEKTGARELAWGRQRHRLASPSHDSS